MKRSALAGLWMICAALGAPALAQESADRIWSGGTILTMNNKAMRAEAVAEKLPPDLQQPGTVEHPLGSPHDGICIGQLLVDLAWVMVEGRVPMAAQ